MPLPVTALYAGLMGLWLLGLSFEVMRRRRRHNVSVGDGGVGALEQATRAHGNACEYVPVALILLGLAVSLPGIPGQGLLTILIGLMLIDFPGKHRLERTIISRPKILRTVNRLRARYDKRPLVLDPPGE